MNIFILPMFITTLSTYNRLHIANS